MVSASQAAQARRKVESQMDTECRVVTLVESVDDNGDTVENETATHYTGMGKIRSTSGVASDKASAGQQYAEQSLLLSIPFDSVHSIYTDATLLALGHKFRIAGLIPQTFSDSQRFPLELIS